MWPNPQFNADLIKVASSSSRLLIYVKYNSHIKRDNKLVLKEGKNRILYLFFKEIKMVTSEARSKWTDIKLSNLIKCLQDSNL